MATQGDRLTAALAERGCVTPALVIDLDQVERNIAAMIRRVGDVARWRPHVKTIKQPRLVELLVDAGVRHFKCATLPELSMTLAVGAERGVALDVLLAYPIAVARAPEISRLAALHGRRIGLTADDPEHLEQLARHEGIDPWIDIDVGMHRTGSSLATWQRWLAAGRRPAVVGVQAYEGHLGWGEGSGVTYAGLRSLMEAVGTARFLLTSGSLAFTAALDSAELSPDRGATPVEADTPGHRWIHQIGAGTLVLGDVATAAPAAAIGGAPAAFVATRVVSRPLPDRITLDAGSKAITPDRPPPNCAVVDHPRWRPSTPSEEHLPVTIDPSDVTSRDQLVLLVPDHVCTTVNLHREAIYVRGDAVIGTGPIAAAGREPPLEARR